MTGLGVYFHGIDGLDGVGIGECLKVFDVVENPTANLLVAGAAAMAAPDFEGSGTQAQYLCCVLSIHSVHRHEKNPLFKCVKPEQRI